MVRPLRIEFPGAVYHITSRGNARNKIFLSEKDGTGFLKILGTTLDRYGWLCHAFCLMDNHYHLLIETIDATLSIGMRHLNGVYTQSFNRRHNRVGHLFQGRFKAVLVQKDAHLLELSRYIVLNPVRAGKVKSPGDWKWSSYASTARHNRHKGILSTDWLLEWFSPERTEAKKRYRDFVTEGIRATSSPWDDLKGQMFLGDEDYIRSVKTEKSGRKEAPAEVPRNQRYADRVSLDALFRGIRDKAGRNAAVFSAYVQQGYKMKEIADFLSLHYTSVSQIIKKEEKTRGSGL